MSGAYAEQLKMQVLVLDIVYKYLCEFKDLELATQFFKNVEFFNRVGVNNSDGSRIAADREEYNNHAGNTEVAYHADFTNVASCYSYASQLSGEYPGVSAENWKKIAETAYQRLFTGAEAQPSVLLKGEAKTARQLHLGLGILLWDSTSLMAGTSTVTPERPGRIRIVLRSAADGRTLSLEAQGAEGPVTWSVQDISGRSQSGPERSESPYALRLPATKSRIGVLIVTASDGRNHARCKLSPATGLQFP